MKALSLKAYGRILWREAAEQYTFCIGIFAMLVVMQASLTTMETFNMIQPPTVAFGFCMALFMTAIYTAASSALLFTAEVDAGTFSFQRTRPIGWLTYLSGKLSWTVLSSIVLGFTAWIETSVWQGVFPDPSDTSMAFGICGVGIVEGMAWGLIATIVVRGPLRAVIFGIAMGSLMAWVSTVVVHWAVDVETVAVTTAYHQAAWLRLIVAAVVLVAGVLAARVWYRTGQPLGRVLLPRLLHGETDSVAVTGQWSSFARPCRGRSIRLLWQAWRHVRSPAVVYWGCCLAALIWVWPYCRAKTVDALSFNNLAFSCTAWAAIVVVGFSSLLAGYTFGADQKARFLQLARDGVSPREIWLSRLVVMATVLLPPAMVVLGLLWHQMGRISELSLFKPLAILLVVLGYSSTLVIGQACSMFVRSRVVALLSAPTMVGCFACWIVLAVFWAGLGWKLGAAPVLLALLIGTRLLAGTRLRQDNSWQAMRVPVLLVVAAVVFSYQAFAYHRAHEIQPYDSAYRAHDLLFSPDHMLRYAKRIGTSWRLHTSPRQWIEDALVTQDDDTFSLYPHYFAHPWRDNTHVFFRTSNAPEVKCYSEMLVGEARLNRTLREVLAQSDVPNERLRACIDFLEDWPKERSRHAAWLAAAYQRDLIWLQHGPLDQQYAEHGFHHKPLPSRYRWFSFERKRMLKLLDRAYRIAAERAEEYENAVINDQVGIPLHNFGLVTYQDIIPHDPARPIWYQFSTEMLLFSTQGHHFRLLESVAWLNWMWDDPFYTAEAQRRGTILYLALRMYYNDNGRLPKALDALVEAEYLDRLPVIPVVCETFYYEPVGAEEKLLEAIEAANEADDQRSWWAHTYGPALLEHHNSSPFLWYPFNRGYEVDPYSGPGWFIDLDFAKQQDQG